MKTKPTKPDAAQVIDWIRAIIWHDGPDTEWSPDTIDAVAAILRNNGYGPKATKARVR